MEQPQQQQGDELKYEFRSIGGGYSEGSKVTYDHSRSKLRAEVNLYGGSKKAAGVYEYAPPAQLAKLIQQFLEAKQQASDSAPELQQQIAQYKQQLAQAIDEEVIAVLKTMDSQIEQAVKKAIRRINYAHK